MSFQSYCVTRERVTEHTKLAKIVSMCFLIIGIKTEEILLLPRKPGEVHHRFTFTHVEIFAGQFHSTGNGSVNDGWSPHSSLLQYISSGSGIDSQASKWWLHIACYSDHLETVVGFLRLLVADNQLWNSSIRLTRRERYSNRSLPCGWRFGVSFVKSNLAL